MNIVTLGIAGGLFALLTMVHFFVDWICQTHSEAMAKHNNWKVRARHCLIYTVGFLPLLWVFKLTPIEFLVSANILFWSHFIEDTYLPVYYWAKYVRRPPEMVEPRKGPPYLQQQPDGSFETAYNMFPPDPKQGFVEFVMTPLGKILMIAVDQIIHLAFLWPIVYMALN